MPSYRVKSDGFFVVGNWAHLQGAIESANNTAGHTIEVIEESAEADKVIFKKTNAQKTGGVIR